MPSAWPSRLRSGPSTPTDGVLPGPQQQGSNDGSLPGLQVPSASSDALRRTHSHNRSSSQPLPKFFSKRRSSFGWGKHRDDDDIMDEASAETLTRLVPKSPVRTDSGKQYSSDASSLSRLCMCCAAHVRVPRNLDVFRCTNCLTVNDLKPRKLIVRPRNAKESGTRPGQHGESTSQVRETRPVPDEALAPATLTVERTRAIIDACLTTFIELRASRARSSPKVGQSYFPDGATDRTLGSGAEQSRRPSEDIVNRSSFEDFPDIGNASAVSTPEEPPSASIKSVADIDYLSYVPQTVSIDKPRTAPDEPSDATRGSGKSFRVPRKAVPVPAAPRRLSAAPVAPTNGHENLPLPPRGPSLSVRRPKPPALVTPEQKLSAEYYERAKHMFRPLEEYINETYGCFESINASFNTAKRRHIGRTHSESALRTPPPEPLLEKSNAPQAIGALPQIDAKTLLVGDFAENGDWWTGRTARSTSTRHGPLPTNRSLRQSSVTAKSPCIDWTKIDEWYDICGIPERLCRASIDRFRSLKIPETDTPPALGASEWSEVDTAFAIGRAHLERAIFKITEGLLHRPGRLLTDPQDIRFILIILANPLIYPKHVQDRRRNMTRNKTSMVDADRMPMARPQTQEPAKHSGILKRCFGLLASSSDTCHQHMISWFSRMPETRFIDMVDLISVFVSYRLSKRRTAPRKGSYVDDNGLIPDLSGSALRTSTQLQRAAGLSGGVRKEDKKEVGTTDYTEDWQLAAATRIMALLFASNNQWHGSGVHADFTDARPRSKVYGQLLPTSDFYNTLLDYQDVIADYKAWESRKETFSFCQYPFLLSMAAKMQILEFDAKRQQETRARETYFNNVISGRIQEVNLQMTVRRECVVEDSLKRISEVSGGMSGDLKKGLRIHFSGEEGVDAGGLRKEWFLLLVRDIFDPNHGLFLYDEDSRLCYFNPHSFETSDQYYLVGVLLGLAIYNSTILDVPLPPFAFRKLLASAPILPSTSASASLPRTSISYTIDDLAEYRPRLAAGLRQLLDFEGDVESTYCWTFSVPTDRYGSTIYHDLCPGGSNKPVTNSNCHEFVTLYIRYLLDTSVARQFEPFKRGFFTVCAGNALSLFRAEEIELLIRGAEESWIDVDALRAVAVYENFRDPHRPEFIVKDNIEEKVERIRWFWEIFAHAEPEMQRRLLQFVTGSDRVPATGAAGLVLRVVAGGDGTGNGDGEELRYPVARTCFNMVVLWGWKSRKQAEERIRGAVEGSEGFGLK